MRDREGERLKGDREETMRHTLVSYAARSATSFVMTLDVGG